MATTTPAKPLFSPSFQSKLDSQFPNALPSPSAAHFPSSTVKPSHILSLPGVSHEGTQLVRRLMEENDRRFHIYGKLSFAHNHLPHHLLTAYSLGATPKQIQAVFEANVEDMAPLERAAWVVKKEAAEGEEGKDGTGKGEKDGPVDVEKKAEGEKRLPGKIDKDNWSDEKLLGKKENYPAYLEFFHTEIDRIGGMETFDKYFLHPSSNSGGKGNKKGPRIFIRMMVGVLHPFIHTGFGLEFKDRVMLAEGFAEAAVHDCDYIAGLFPDNWPKAGRGGSMSNGSGEGAQGNEGGRRRRTSQTVDTDRSFIDPRRTSISNSNLTSTDNSTTTPLNFSTSLVTGYRGLSHPSLLDLYAELCSSDKIKLPPYDTELLINDRLHKAAEGDQGAEIRRIADKWALTEGELVKSGEADGWARRVEELQVLCTLLAVGTGRPGKKARVDFFLMHCLTSSIFLKSFLIHLTAPHRLILLRSYLYIVFITALARGRPHISVESVLEHTAYPSSSRRKAKKDEEVKGLDEERDVAGRIDDAEYGNVWTDVIDNALHAHDSHVPKAIRSLLYFSTLYGHLPPGSLLGSHKPNSKEESIPNIAKLGGDLFIRGAGIIFEQTGWPRDRKQGDEEDAWDRSCLGYDEAWKDEK